MASLDSAHLTSAERQALGRFVELLVTHFGSDLHGVWLYGSRARGEGNPADSDVDVLVITSGGRADRERVRKLKWQVYAEIEEAMMQISSQVHSPGWVKDRRAIEAFFIQEVDRDKVVLQGGP